MIGKVKVTTKNPPCRDCGGMAGYHSKDCPKNPALIVRPEGFIERWAKDVGCLGIAARYALLLESALKDKNSAADEEAE